MTRMELFSEPFAKTGNIAAEGFKKLLGSPARDMLQTMLREAIQNSVDAAKLQCGPEALIRVRTLNAEQHHLLVSQVLTTLPPQDDVISRSLRKGALRVLEICDFNSTGLGGPTSADVVSENEQPQDFVNFVRNVGIARDTHHGGGTYGYGKTSLYALSACSTIIVDTQTVFNGQPVRRLIGCHLGAAYDANVSPERRKRFTGRHWWGVIEDGGVDPLVGATAGATAAALGMPGRDQVRTGTSILIVDPLLDESKEDEWLWHYIREALLWNFWPRLTASTPEDRKLTLNIEIEGVSRTLPAPEDFPPLDLFASALAAYRAGNGGELIKCGRPKKDLGRIVIKRGLCADRFASSLADASLIPSQCSHVALMRPVELVVKYVVGTPYADPRFGWAGVFVCSDDNDIEAAFAMSEPPAHDDWVPDNLPTSNARTFVRVALKQISDRASTYAFPVIAAANREGVAPSLARTAMRLGRLLDSVSGQGPGKKTRAGGGKGKSKRLSMSSPRFVRLELFPSGQRYALFEADLQNDGRNPALQVSAEAYLVLDGGRAGSADLPLAYVTEVRDIYFEGTGRTSNKPHIIVGTASGIIRVSVLSPFEAAVGVRLSLGEGGGE